MREYEVQRCLGCGSRVVVDYMTDGTSGTTTPFRKGRCRCDATDEHGKGGAEYLQSVMARNRRGSAGNGAVEASMVSVRLPPPHIRSRRIARLKGHAPQRTTQPDVNTPSAVRDRPEQDTEHPHQLPPTEAAVPANRAEIKAALAAFMEYMKSGVSPRAAAAATGIPSNTIRRIMGGHSPQTHNVDKLMTWYGSRSVEAGTSAGHCVAEGADCSHVHAPLDVGASIVNGAETTQAADGAERPSTEAPWTGSEAVVLNKGSVSADPQARGGGSTSMRTSRRIVGPGGWAQLEELHGDSSTLTLHLCHPDTEGARNLYRLLEDAVAAGGVPWPPRTTLGS